MVTRYEFDRTFKRWQPGESAEHVYVGVYVYVNATSDPAAPSTVESRHRGKNGRRSDPDDLRFVDCSTSPALNLVPNRLRRGSE